jgi:hypothetical protein
MSNRTAFRVFCMLGLAVVAQVWMMPHVPYQVAQDVLLKGVMACTVAGGFLIWRYAPSLD